MAVITPPSITALPSPPNPAVRSTFNALAYPWSVALGPYSTELAAVAANVEHNATEAATSATTAATQAGIATTQAGTATTQAGIATAQAVLAAASAASASNAANVNGTSTDSESIPTIIGQQRTFTMVESSRDIVPGMFLVAAVTASPTTNWALFQVDSFASNAWTGTCKAFGGSGTFSAWTVSLSSARGPAGADAVVTTPSLALSGTPTLTAGNNGYTGDVAAGTAIALDTLATLGDGWSIILVPATGAASTVTADFGAGSTAKTLATATLISVKLVSGTYTVRWIPFGQAVPELGALGTPVVVKAYNQQNIFTAVPLTNTTSLVIYVASGTTLEAAVVTRSGASLSVGTPIVLDTDGEGTGKVAAKVISSTRVLVMHGLITSGAVRMVMLSISGTTVTENTAIDLASGAGGTDFDFALCSPTVAMAVYKSSATVAAARHIAISDVTLTQSAAVNVVSDAGTTQLVGISAAAISATQAVVYARHGAAQGAWFSLVAFSGTAPAHVISRSVPLGNGAGGNTALIELSNGNVLGIAFQQVTDAAHTLVFEIKASGSQMIFGPMTPVLYDYSTQPFPRPAELANGRVAIATTGQATNSVVSFLERVGSSEAWRFVTGRGVTGVESSNNPVGGVFSIGNDYLGVMYKDVGNSNYTTARTLGLGNIATS